MNPAACARAKKAARLAREAALVTPEPPRPPRTPEEAYKAYRKSTRPYRRAFRGIISRRDAERFFTSRARKTTRAIHEAQETS